MARPTQLLRAALILILVVVAMAATATGAPRRRRVPPPPLPLQPEEFGITVYCSEVHGVRAGETCRSVAREARIPLSQVMELNPNITCGALFPGQWVCVNGVEVA